MSCSSQAAVDHLRSHREELNAFLENAADSLTEDEARRSFDDIARAARNEVIKGFTMERFGSEKTELDRRIAASSA